MRHIFAAVLACLPALVCAQGAAGDTQSGKLLEQLRGEFDKKGLESLLTDSSAGSVTAAALAGLTSQSPLNVIENVRDFSVLINAFDQSNSKGFGVALTPGRTNFPVPNISLQDYAKNNAYRLLANLTLSYAQGKTTEPGTSYLNRAVSVSTSAFWNKEDDPAVAVATAQCGQVALAGLPDTPVMPAVPSARRNELRALERRKANNDAAAIQAIQAIEAKAAGNDANAKAELNFLELARLQRRVNENVPGALEEFNAFIEKQQQQTKLPAETIAAANKAYKTCADAVLLELGKQWNRTRYALSFATGTTKRSDGSGSSTNLGQVYMASLLYGFDGVKALDLQNRAAVTLSLRHARSEPVLKTLGTANVRFVDSTLMSARLSGGSHVFRGIVEGSNTRSRDITTTQRAFLVAAGVDYRVVDGLWLNLRYGRQRKVDGTGSENGSLLVLNYSPSASLAR